jgi:hypothetical protein
MREGGRLRFVEQRQGSLADTALGVEVEIVFLGEF